jgi:hypothetical protein
MARPATTRAMTPPSRLLTSDRRPANPPRARDRSGGDSRLGRPAGAGRSERAHRRVPRGPLALRGLAPSAAPSSRQPSRQTGHVGADRDEAHRPWPAGHRRIAHPHGSQRAPPPGEASTRPRSNSTLRVGQLGSPVVMALRATSRWATLGSTRTAPTGAAQAPKARQSTPRSPIHQGGIGPARRLLPDLRRPNRPAASS